MALQLLFLMIFLVPIAFIATWALSKWGSPKYREPAARIRLILRRDRYLKWCIPATMVILLSMSIFGGHPVDPLPAPAPTIALTDGQQQTKPLPDHCMVPLDQGGGPAAIQSLLGRFPCDKNGKPTSLQKAGK